MGADVVLGALLNLAKTMPEIPLLHFSLFLQFDWVLVRSAAPTFCAIDVSRVS